MTTRKGKNSRTDGKRRGIFTPKQLEKLEEAKAKYGVRDHRDRGPAEQRIRFIRHLVETGKMSEWRS